MLMWQKTSSHLDSHEEYSQTAWRLMLFINGPFMFCIEMIWIISSFIHTEDNSKYNGQNSSIVRTENVIPSFNNYISLVYSQTQV